MKTSAQMRVRAAEAELIAAERQLAKDSLPLRERLREHRGALIVLGGFGGGLALSLLPTRWWGRIGAAVGTLTAAAARSILTPAFMGAALTKVRGGDARTPEHRTIH